MNFKTQKRLAGKILKCSPRKIVLDADRHEDIKESITKSDLRSLIKDKAIQKSSKSGPSRVRARKNAEQKRKGRRKGYGSRKGRNTARSEPKTDWINRIRKQRQYLKVLREKGTLDAQNYKVLYRRAGGGFFRSLRHLKIYVEEFMKKN